MDNEIQHQAPLSPIHLDRFQHQGQPTIEPNLTVEDTTRLRFLMGFLSKNAYKIQRRLDVKFQPSINWT